MIAFGNRAQMTGLEADTWYQLKMKMVHTLQRADAEAKKATGPELVLNR